MERAASPRADGTGAARGLKPWLWCVLLLGLVAGHTWKTLHLFGADSLPHLLDDQPIVSGKHPLHLYHGHLGAWTFLNRHHFSCYDPAFQAGYPKTPVFDSGSRPAELALAAAGGAFDPAAYKIGLAVGWWLVPLLLIVACRGAGLGGGATALGTAAGLLVCWSTPARRALEFGELDLLLAALTLLAHAGLLLRFDRAPGLLSWQGLLLTGCLGWFLHPVLFLLVVPLLLAYYLSVGARHAVLTWHLGLGLAELGAVAANGFWLVDWVRFLWLRAPLAGGDGMLLHRTLQTLWEAPQWGDEVDRILGAVLLISAVIGVALFNQTNQRVTARVLGLGAGGLWLLALLGIAWEPLGFVGTSGLMVPAWWFATVPAAHAWTRAYHLVGFLSGSRGRAAALVCVVLATVVGTRWCLAEALTERCVETAPLALGLGEERLALVEALKRQTTADARILWEDKRGRPEVPYWTALLPVLTGRSFVGGLDPRGEIEHGGAGLVNQALRGRPLAQWSDAALESYCKRYNIGWIACWSPEVIVRLQSWKGAVEVARLSDGGPVYLFAVTAAPKSFTLKGQATILHMDSQHITLADVVPEDGVVVLSLHYQSGLRAAPARVQVDRDEDAADMIPFVRLRLDRPAARVTLTWTE
jgi:hypothetical protein